MLFYWVVFDDILLGKRVPVFSISDVPTIFYSIYLFYSTYFIVELFYFNSFNGREAFLQLYYR